MTPIRIVIDLRPLQNAGQAPVTAAYLGNLLRAFAADPVEGETFVPLLQAGLPDPTDAIPRLPVSGRRWLPPTGPLRAAALTTDPFLLRAAEIGTGRNAIYHVAGADLPLGSGLPVVATLLDLAPWELPDVFQTSPASQFGQRLRARILRDAAAVIVGSRLVATSARRLLHLHADRLHVVPFAATEWDALAGAATESEAATGPSEPYLAFFGRHDARSDVRTLFDTLALLRSRTRPSTLAPEVPWPPRLVLVGATPEDRAEIARSAARRDVDDLIGYAPYGSLGRRAEAIAHARAVVIPAVADAAAVGAIDALALGTPVVASGVGGLAEIVGGAGVIVPPRDPERLARALTATWSDDGFHGKLMAAAAGSTYAERTWADVATATRAVYAAAARS